MNKLQLNLKTCGVSGQPLSPILNVLRTRSQVTKAGCHISQSVSLTSGVVLFEVAASAHSCF